MTLYRVSHPPLNSPSYQLIYSRLGPASCVNWHFVPARQYPYSANCLHVAGLSALSLSSQEPCAKEQRDPNSQYPVCQLRQSSVLYFCLVSLGGLRRKANSGVSALKVKDIIRSDRG